MKILVPTLGESVAEATVAKWLKKKGDNVSKDEVLVELETDKATLEVYAQSNGVLSEIYINAGQDVEIGAELAEFLEKEGIDAPASSHAKAYANAKYWLWHANQQGRYNILNGIMPPESGHWLNNPHADDIDFQIEAYIKDFSQLTNINRNMISDNDNTFIIETGIARGIDALVKYNSKKLYVWIVYSLGQVIRDDGVREYSPHFDRRHNINFVTSYKFG